MAYRYIHHATHNYDTLQRRGGVCVCCMQDVAFRDITGWIQERAGRPPTAQCPHCDIDAVVPRDAFSSRAELEAWHRAGFEYIAFDAAVERQLDGRPRIPPPDNAAHE